MSALEKWFNKLFPIQGAQRYQMGLTYCGPRDSWEDFLEAVLHNIITGPLYALGLVDVGPSLDAVKAIRLHGGLQDLTWYRRMEIALEAVGKLQPGALQFIPSEHILEIETPLPPDFVTFVLKWAEPAGFSNKLVRYRLSVSRLHRAFERGLEPDALEAAWISTTGLDPLPDVTQWWETWWQRYGHVRIYPAQALLQTRDAATMRELQVALPRLQSSSLGALSPEAMLLAEESVDGLVSDLTRQGYMPKET
jgi:hypothetical protein